MIVTRETRNGMRLLALSAMSVAFGVPMNQARAQVTQQYFDVNGATAGYGIVTGSTYSWDDPNWAVPSGGGTATSNFVPGGFARFYGGVSGNTYTVTVGQDESMAGLFLNVSGVTLNINQAAGTSGDLNVVASTGTDAPNQGFLITGAASTVIINAPITGAGGVEQETTGALALYGNNTYTGGTKTTGGQALYYNNKNSFGSGAITLTGTGTQGFVNGGATGLNIANNVIFGGTATVTNFASGSGTGGAPGAIWSGTFTLPSTGTTTFEAGTATQVTQISGVISGAAAIKLAVNPGTLILSGANTYTGSTTISTGTLKLGAANTIASSTSIIMSGGTLNPGGLNQIMSSTTLGLTANSTIDFGVGASEIDFANSSLLTWTGTLNLTNWNPAVDAIRFGTDSTGLSSAQLAKILFNGTSLGTTSLTSSGYLVAAPAASATPEPSTWALMGMGLSVGGVGARTLRKRRAQGGV